MKEIRRENPEIPGYESLVPVDRAAVDAWNSMCPSYPPCHAEGAEIAAQEHGRFTVIDALRWRLPMPPRFMPYMEKYRIYDLFYELAVELVIQRPKDHVQFIKHQLINASISKDRPRVIIIGPPFFDMEPLGKKLAAALKLPYVPVLKRYYSPKQKEGCETTRRPGESLPRYVARVLRTEPLLSGGWVMAGFPRSAGEAELMRRAGVRPTHVIQLVPSISTRDTCLFSESCKFTPEEVKKYLEYTRRIRGLREIFMPVLKEVDIRQPSLESLVKLCLARVRDGFFRGPPSVYRVVIVGPPGSGVHTQAKLIAQRFNLILVDAAVEEVRARLDECYERLLDAAGEKIIPNDRLEVLQTKLMDPQLLHYGWVLIGCPRNVGEMRGLDRLDTPPNRVLVLDVPKEECRDRLVLRRFSKYTGAEYHLDRDQIPLRDRTGLSVHPEDAPSHVDRRMNEFMSMLPSLLEYLGDSAQMLHAAGQPVERVFEMASAAVQRRPPPFAPRDPEAPLPAAPPPTPTSQFSRSLLDDMLGQELPPGDELGYMDERERSTSRTSASSLRPPSRVRLSARLAARSPKRPAGRYALMAARVGWPYDRRNTLPSQYQREDSTFRPDSTSQMWPNDTQNVSYQPSMYGQSNSLTPYNDTGMNRLSNLDDDGPPGGYRSGMSYMRPSGQGEPGRPFSARDSSLGRERPTGASLPGRMREPGVGSSFDRSGAPRSMDRGRPSGLSMQERPTRDPGVGSQFDRRSDAPRASENSLDRGRPSGLSMPERPTRDTGVGSQFDRRSDAPRASEKSPDRSRPSGLSMQERPTRDSGAGSQFDRRSGAPRPTENPQDHNRPSNVSMQRPSMERQTRDTGVGSSLDQRPTEKSTRGTQADRASALSNLSSGNRTSKGTSMTMRPSETRGTQSNRPSAVSARGSMADRPTMASQQGSKVGRLSGISEKGSEIS